MLGDDGRPAGGLLITLLLSTGVPRLQVPADVSASRRAGGSEEGCLKPACTGSKGGSVSSSCCLGREAHRLLGGDAARGAGTGDPRLWPGGDDARGTGIGDPGLWLGGDDARGAGTGMNRWTLQGCPESKCRSTCHGSSVQAPPSPLEAASSASWPRPVS